MAKFIWAVLCQRIIADSGTNAVSYIDLLESIGTKLPSALPPVMVGTLWVKERDGDEVEMRVNVLDPSGKVIHTQTAQKAVFGEQYKRFRVHLGVFGPKATDPGVYEFAIEARKGKGYVEVARLPLEVVGLSEEQVQAGKPI